MAASIAGNRMASDCLALVATSQGVCVSGNWIGFLGALCKTSACGCLTGRACPPWRDTALPEFRQTGQPPTRGEDSESFPSWIGTASLRRMSPRPWQGMRRSRAAGCWAWPRRCITSCLLTPMHHLSRSAATEVKKARWIAVRAIAIPDIHHLQKHVRGCGNLGTA
jgi:hypothetical protein